MPPLPKTWMGAAVLLCGAAVADGSDDFSIYDLTWNGYETSTVQECVDGDLFCETLTIDGSIAVALDAEAPRLINVDSDIVIPPQLPGSRPLISPNLWNHFDLLAGEYLPSDSDDTLAMAFRPAQVGGVLRQYELLVEITDGGQFLSLTGGIEQDAASPMEPDVRFYVSGRLEADTQLVVANSLPEPSMSALLLVGAVLAIASRARR